MLSFLLLIAILILGLLIPNKKISTTIFLIYLWILLAFGYDNPDFLNYSNMYKYFSVVNRNLTISNFGFQILCRIFYNLGLNYQQFLVIEASAICIMLGSFVIKNCLNPFACVILFFIYPFIIETTQIRNCFAAMLMITAISMYVNNNGSKSYFLMVMFLVLSFSIHFSYAAFLILFLIPFMKKKYLLFWVMMIFFLQLILFTNINRIALLITNQNQILRYLGRSVSIETMLFLVAYFLIMYFPVYFINKYINQWFIAGTKLKKLAETVVKVNILMLVFIPYCFITNDFMRFFRSIFILNYCVLINAYYLNKNMVVKRIKLNKFPLINLLTYIEMFFSAFSCYFYIIMPYLDIIVIPLFKNNAIIP